MQLNYLEVNGNLEEVTCHGTPAFPMEVYLDDLDLYPNRSIPWHWHKELELVYVLRGAIEFQTGVRSYVLSSGQGGLLPPNMLHMVAPYHHQRGSAYCAVLADHYLLHGLSGGLVEAQCASFITGADVDFFLLDNTCPWHKEALSSGVPVASPDSASADRAYAVRKHGLKTGKAHFLFRCPIQAGPFLPYVYPPGVCQEDTAGGYCQGSQCQHK